MQLESELPSGHPTPEKLMLEVIPEQSQNG
jgi:hypothetical protein